MTSDAIKRRIDKLEAGAASKTIRYAWRPDNVSDDQHDAWLADLRLREGWGEDADVMVLVCKGLDMSNRYPDAPH